MNVRRPTTADAEAVAALIGAYDASHGLEPTETAADVLEYWQVQFDLEQDAWLFEVAGRLAGAAFVHRRRDDLAQGDGYVHPDFTGRGIGAEILRLTEEWARERGMERVHNGTLHADERALALLAASGYAFVRAFLRMEIELAEEPRAPTVPAGLTVAPATPADDAAVHAAVQEAFEDHWEHAPTPLDAWLRRREGSDRSLWFVARDGDEVAGAGVNDLERFGVGWIGTVGVRRAWRGRGLAQALLLASFGEFFRRGQRRVQLGVDASNPTGAVAVYERVGMREVFRADVFEKRL